MPDPIPLIVQGDESVSLSPEELRVINAVSPEATVEQNAYGAEIVIKDLAHGTTRAQIYDGRQGVQGDDGFSPVITSEAITGGHRITIVDAAHPQGFTVDVMNGRDGVDGMDGTDGTDGKGIVSIEKTSTSGLEDAYTITYTTGAPTTFTVTNGRDGTDGTNGRDGKDGTDGTTFTPTVSAEGVISWTNDGNKQNPPPVNIKGHDGANGQDGAPGRDGTNGTNGVSPTVTVTDITGGHRITITDAEHPQGQSIDVMDGQNGADGTNAYVWIRYAAAQPTQDSDMSTTPGPWMGVYSGSSATAPEHYTDYTWYEIKGNTPTVPVTDVQVNGVSVLDNGVANVPVAGESTFGTVRTESRYGVSILTDSDRYGILRTNSATDTVIKNGIDSYRPITPGGAKAAAFYGLAKAAGDSTQSASSNAVGTYTDDAKVAIQKMLGIYQAPWELIREDTVTNATEADIVINVDGDGNAFELTDTHIWMWFPTQNSEAKNASGIVYFYYDAANFYTAVTDVKTVNANSAESIAFASLTQDKGLISIRSVAYGNSGAIGTWRYCLRGSLDDARRAMRLGAVSISKIGIPKITGTFGYRIFGRRKWTL